MESVGASILDLLQLTALQLLQLFGLLAGLGVVLHLLEKGVFKLHSRAFGYKAAIWTTGWLGTPVHECGHLIFCLPFAHKVEEAALFRPDEKSGTLGYVKHSYNPRNPWAQVGQLFIGFGPLLLGSAVIFGALWGLVPDSADELLRVRAMLVEGGFGFGETLRDVWHGAVLLAQSLITEAHIKTWQFWLFAYIALCVAAHMGPSRADLQGGLWGFFLWVVVLLTLNAVSLFAFDTPTGPLVGWIWSYASWLAALFLLAAAVALLNLVATWLILAVLAKLTGKPLPVPW